MPQNLIVMRRDTERIINDDPWTITFYRKARLAGGDETDWSCTGRITPFGAHGATSITPLLMPSESGRTKHGWIALCPWGTEVPREGDEVRAVQTSTSIERAFTVFHGQQYAYKLEVVMDEVQQ